MNASNPVENSSLEILYWEGSDDFQQSGEMIDGANQLMELHLTSSYKAESTRFMNLGKM